MTDIIVQRLRETGFEFDRCNKHPVYRRQDGKTFDSRWEGNAATALARVLGVPRKDLLHVDHKPLRALRPHAPLPKHENPAALQSSAPEPAPSPSIVLSKQDRKLTKRLARIERNQAAKREKRQRQKQAFLTGNAVLFLTTGEFFFYDTMPRQIRELMKWFASHPADEGTIAREYLEAAARPKPVVSERVR